MLSSNDGGNIRQKSISGQAKKIFTLLLAFHKKFALHAQVLGYLLNKKTRPDLGYALVFLLRI